jgi:hypothetical protein
MTVNTDKTKVMIIKSDKITYDTFIYDKKILEEVPSYKYLGSDINRKLNWNYSIEKRINRVWKSYYGLENNCKLSYIWLWDKKNILYETLVTPINLYVCELWGSNISRESWRKIEHIQKNFITYNLKIKGNTPYPILLIEAIISPIESTTMIRYLMYKNKINNMDDKRLPIISSNSSQNHQQLKRGWHNDAKSWLNNWGISSQQRSSNSWDCRQHHTRTDTTSCGFAKDDISVSANNVDCHTSSNPSRMRYYVMFPHWMSVMFSWANHICGSTMLFMSLDPAVSLFL